jgi:hypothetical protein
MERINFSEKIFLIGAGYSLTHDIESLKQIYMYYKPMIISCDTIYTYLLSQGIESDIVANLDNRDEKLEMMKKYGEIEPRNSKLLSNFQCNEYLWNLWNNDKKIENVIYPFTYSVISNMLTYACIEYPEKEKYCLGFDLCWIDNEDKYYIDGSFNERAKKNIEIGSEYDNRIDEGYDIYNNKVKTNSLFWLINLWMENFCKLQPKKVINASSGPTIFGINSDDIIKIKDLVNELSLEDKLWYSDNRRINLENIMLFFGDNFANE